MGRLGQEVVRAREYTLCELWDVLVAAVASGDTYTADLYGGAMAIRILGGGGSDGVVQSR